MNTVRILLFLATMFDWNLQQFDVKNAFLHGDLEKVFMEPPPGFNRRFGNDKVYRLRKALYGLKQSPRAWFGRFTKAMLEMGYKVKGITCYSSNTPIEVRLQLFWYMWMILL